MTSTIERPKPSKAKESGPVGVGTAGTPQRRKQMPWAVLGVLLACSSVLGFFMWSQQQSERTPVLVAATSIDAGEVIERSDLRLVAIGSDPGVVLLEQRQMDLIVGQVARGPIPEGTPMSELLVVETNAVPERRKVVGALLSPGEYPTSALRAGDQVEMVRVVPRSGADDQAIEVIGVATVWTIEDLYAGAEPRLFISLLVEEDQSGTVANAVSLDEFRLVLVRADS